MKGFWWALNVGLIGITAHLPKDFISHAGRPAAAAVVAAPILKL